MSSEFTAVDPVANVDMSNTESRTLNDGESQLETKEKEERQAKLQMNINLVSGIEKEESTKNICEKEKDTNENNGNFEEEDSTLQILNNLSESELNTNTDSTEEKTEDKLNATGDTFLAKRNVINPPLMNTQSHEQTEEDNLSETKPNITSETGEEEKNNKTPSAAGKTCAVNRKATSPPLKGKLRHELSITIRINTVFIMLVFVYLNTADPGIGHPQVSSVPSVLEEQVGQLSRQLTEAEAKLKRWEKYIAHASWCRDKVILWKRFYRSGVTRGKQGTAKGGKFESGEKPDAEIQKSGMFTRAFRKLNRLNPFS